MSNALAVPLAIAGLTAAVWPYRLALWQERWDSIGSTRDYGDVEPAQWRVTLTRALGVLLVIAGVGGGLLL